REFAVPESFIGPVVEIDMRELNFRGIQGSWVDGKAMILGSYFDFVRQEVLYGMVSPAMAKLELERCSAQCQGQQLVSKANPEDRFFFNEEFDGLDRIAHSCRIAG